MQPNEDTLFADWCRCGDARALGELFDLAAPRLLKLAIHLVGDAVDAEDLVQATFLTAIERRTSVDPTRPVMPWLSGVLAHKAQQLRRRSARTFEAGELAVRVAEDASRPLERRELDGEVARAIDALGEPYRAVLVLRLRHGMEPADIAHVLERDAGTVRVQLHRGLEKLRAALPAALATSALLGLLAPRGMAAIKGSVMKEATAALAGATSAATIGGLIVGKKTLVAVAAALGLAALVWLRDRSPNVGGARAIERAPALAQAPSARPGDDELAEVGRSAAADARATREALDEPAATPMARGTVVDAETKLALVGARLRSFAPREARVPELVRAAPDLYLLETGGRLRARTRGDWPLVVARSEAARFGRESVLAFDRPWPREEPLAETRSGADGGFALDSAANGAVIECAHDGYATRWRPVRGVDASTAIELWREREVRGVVLGPDGLAVGEPLDLVFTAMRTLTLEQSQKALPDQSDGLCEAFGAWSTRSDAAGRFAARVGARALWPWVTTPGWCVEDRAVLALDEFDEHTIQVRRMPAFHFFDAATRAPIERVRLLGRELSNQYAMWAGEFSAPAGVLTLPGDASLARWLAENSLGLVFWSEGYRAARVSITDLASAGTIEVSMERGVAGALDGAVARGREPVAGAEVALIGRSPNQWGVDTDWIVDAVLTAADGSFHLEAPDGLYVVRVRGDTAPFLEKITWPDRPNAWGTRVIAGREPFFQEIALPASGPLWIDLARAGRVEVEIADALGVPQVGHVISLRSDGGRQLMANTDEHGVAGFANLPAGKFRLHTPHVNTMGSWAGGELREVELAAGAVERVRTETPATRGPRHAPVRARGAPDYSGWRARYYVDAWRALAPDGTVPMDLGTDRFRLEVASPDDRHWNLPIPKHAPDGHVIELEPGAGAYRGELLRADGAPRAGVIVFTMPWGPSRTSDVQVFCTTDERGRFELAGLAPGEYRIRFQTNVDRQLEDEWGNELAGLSYVPAVPPSEAGTWLSIRAAEPAELTRIRGLVQRASGERLPSVQLVFECAVPDADGALLVGGRRSFTHADEHGQFDLELPRAPRISVGVYASWSADGRVLQREIEPAELAGSVALVVP